MITNLRRKLRPSINMHVLELGMFRCLLRHKHMVELLRIHVEEVRVALRVLDVRLDVQIPQVADLGVPLERLYEGEFVEVAGSNDACFAVLREDVLRGVSWCSMMCVCVYVFVGGIGSDGYDLHGSSVL